MLRGWVQFAAVRYGREIRFTCLGVSRSAGVRNGKVMRGMDSDLQAGVGCAAVWCSLVR